MRGETNPPQISLADVNLCAFQITADTFKYVGNIFSALCLPWGYLLDDKEFQIYHDFFLRYYGSEAAVWFSQVKKWNTTYFVKIFRRLLEQSGKKLTRATSPLQSE